MVLYSTDSFYAIELLGCSSLVQVEPPDLCNEGMEIFPFSIE